MPAEFSCEATNCLGSVKTSGKLTVDEKQATELLPYFELPLSNMDVLAGQPLTLKCTVGGDPVPDITWYHSGRPVRKSAGGFETLYDESGEASLTLSKALPKLSGLYVCRAKNRAGEATSTSVVTVKAIRPA